MSKNALYISIFIYQFTCLSIHLSIYLFDYISTYIHIYLYLYLPTDLAIHPSNYQFIHQSINPYIYLPTYFFVSTYLPTFLPFIMQSLYLILFLFPYQLYALKKYIYSKTPHTNCQGTLQIPPPLDWTQFLHIVPHSFSLYEWDMPLTRLSLLWCIVFSSTPYIWNNKIYP